MAARLFALCLHHYKRTLGVSDLFNKLNSGHQTLGQIGRALRAFENIKMPRKYSRISTRATSYTKEALDIAINKIKNNELSYAEASKIFNIPISTLNHRVRKKGAIMSNTLGRPTAISKEHENKLAQSLRTMEKRGWGLSRDEAIDITQEFIKNNKLQTPFKDGRPGPDWFISFRQRHNLSIKKTKSVEYLRKKMTDSFDTPFKVVQTHERNKLNLFTVPSGWENSNVLKYPKKMPGKYVKDENSMPTDDWHVIKCKVIGYAISYEAGDIQISEIINDSDTKDVDDTYSDTKPQGE